MSENLHHSNSLAVIIEDDSDLAMLFAITLQGANYETEIIQEGRSATERLTMIIPDVVILDLHLPFISGTCERTPL